MKADVLAPTALDEAVWSLYLAVEVNPDDPALRTCAWHIRQAACCLFPARHARLSKRRYRRRHPDKVREARKRREARLKVERPEWWRATKRRHKKAKSPEARKRRQRIKSAKLKWRRANDPAYREQTNAKARARQNIRYATDEAYRERQKAWSLAFQRRRRAERTAEGEQV